MNSPLPPGLGNIKRVVVLMFENRSFDHVFGALPGVNGLFKDGGIKPECYNLPDPLQPASFQNLPVYPAPLDPSRPIGQDFTHDFGDGMMPDLFGPVFQTTGAVNDPNATYTSGYANGTLVGQIQPPPQTFPATNSGFASTYNSCCPQGQAAMTFFKPAALGPLHDLARSYVVCDNWHCDMPGHTLPNRAFMHCGQTGVSIDDLDGGTVNADTVFDRIKDAKSTLAKAGWKMYAPVDAAGNLGQLDTGFLANQAYYPGAPLTEFATDCEDGALPFYSFIMCWLPSSTAWTDTSMHPGALIQPGENLLAAVYNTLRNSPCWENTLLVVNFDENGGLYDHVFPPQTTPPTPSAAPATQSTEGCCGNNWILNSTFDFSLLGLRVPALLISPWLRAGVDSTQYQNTSALRLVLDLIAANSLTERDANAPQLQSVFRQFGQDQVRDDCPPWIKPHSTLPSIDPSTGSNCIPYSNGQLTAWNPPSGTGAARPVPYTGELMNIYTAPLPGHPDSGRKITREFATNDEVASYLTERAKAATEYYQRQSPRAAT